MSIIPFSDYRSILCLNGTLPSVSFFKNDLPVIAADGAANTLMRMGITPKVVIGDLDSLEVTLQHQLSTIFIQDQDRCDFSKSLEYLDKQQFLPTIVTGLNGGYLDHILNNVNLFLHTKNLCYAPPIVGWVVSSSEYKEFVLPKHTKISLLGIPSALVSTRGLQWELDQYSLAFPGKTSCFNRSIKSMVRVEVHEGCVFVLIYE